MATEFTSRGYLRDRLTCFLHDFKKQSKGFIKKLMGRKTQKKFDLKQRYSEGYAKKVVIKKKLAITTEGKPSWFYTAFERKDSDPLTNYTLQFIQDNLEKDKRILVTGCGTGITVFHLADVGFKEVVGSDLLPECIEIANKLKEDFKYTNTRFQIDDGFHPTINEKFDLITALHWVFSAWMGNYGNSPVQNPYDEKTRIEALSNFLTVYSKLLNENGYLIIELTDAVTDYRLSTDHPMGEYSKEIYPIRHTPEQVETCAFANGLSVVDKKLSVSYGHHPRVSYYLKKTTAK
jgi:SAM-dependent methyltransferase